MRSFKNRGKKAIESKQKCEGERKSFFTEKVKREKPNDSRKVSSSYKEHKENALASGAEEGRDKLRKAAGSCK